MKLDIAFPRTCVTGFWGIQCRDGSISNLDAFKCTMHRHSSAATPSAKAEGKDHVSSSRSLEVHMLSRLGCTNLLALALYQARSA